jgi:hypothetical protein
MNIQQVFELLRSNLLQNHNGEINEGFVAEANDLIEAIKNTSTLRDLEYTALCLELDSMLEEFIQNNS